MCIRDRLWHPRCCRVDVYRHRVGHLRVVIIFPHFLQLLLYRMISTQQEACLLYTSLPQHSDIEIAWYASIQQEPNGWKTVTTQFYIQEFSEYIAPWANVETGHGHGPLNHFFDPVPLIKIEV